MKSNSEDTHHCAGCPLEGKETPLIGKPRDSEYALVTDVPCYKAGDRGRLMPKLGASVLLDCLAESGFEPTDFSLLPMVRCAYDPDVYTTKEKKEIAQHCRPYLVEALAKQVPAVILPLGNAASAQVLRRATKITKVRGQPLHSEEFPDSVILPLLNPMQVALYAQHTSTMKADCNTLARLVENDYDKDAASDAAFGEVNYSIIEDLQFLIDADPEIVGFDIEATGLRWFAPDAKILTMQFCIEPGTAYLLPWDHPDAPRSTRQKAKLRRQLRELLNGRKVVGQNAKFDCVYTRMVEGVDYLIGGCTLMLATLLDENALTKNLDDLVKRYVPEMAGYADGFNATVDKSNMISLPLDDKFIFYGCGDADAALRVYLALYPKVVEDKKLFAHYCNVTIPGLNAFSGVEARGLDVDSEQVDEFEAFMAERVAHQYEELLKQVPREIRRAHIDKGLAFSRKDFVLDILFRHPKGFKLKPKVYTKTTAKLEPSRRVPSTSSKDHLPYFFDDCPFTYELAQYIKDERILSTSVRGFKNKYIIGNKVRPTYNLHVTVTGRSSSESPNGQNFPKRGDIAKTYRKIFVAPPGWIILEADYSQAELRIAGDMANDPTMISIYRDNGDIHTATALIVMGVTMAQFVLLPKDEQKSARTKAKAVNFGFLYGMGWRKFIAYAKTQYGVEFTEKEAQRIRAAFFAKYPKLEEWHKKMRQFAHTHGYVRSYSGRVRHLPMIHSSDELVVSEAERQAINSPVQEFGSALGVMASGRIHCEVDPEYFQLIGFVHDAIYALVRERHVEWGAKLMKRYMESNPIEEVFGTRLKIPITADVSFGKSLGEVNEMPSLKLNEAYDFGVHYDLDKKSGILLPEQRTPKNRGMREHQLHILC